jgi:DNA-binding LytR/AlgR family response regulator
MNKTKVSLFTKNPQTEKQLKACTERFNSLQLKSICHDDIDVIDCFALHTPDIWFIDVPSEKELNTLLEISPLPPFIVAITPNDISVQKLLNRGIFDVLPVDFSLEHFAVVIKKISRIINRYQLPVHEFREPTMEYFTPSNETKDHIFINIKNRRCRVVFDKVMLIEKTGSSLKITTEEGGPIYYNSTLNLFLKRLPENMFLRINGSTIVNINKVENYSRTEVFINKAVKKITRQYADTFSQVLEK